MSRPQQAWGANNESERRKERSQNIFKIILGAAGKAVTLSGKQTLLFFITEQESFRFPGGEVCIKRAEPKQSKKKRKSTHAK